ncbi:MAG: DUF4093 domain-containing protein [Bacillota bacterium]|nr:DUF4093 domain-containing protein [Bacillota bacterium]
MIKINSAVIVEGNYDKIRLSKIVDANIIATGGFRIFRDEKMRLLIRTLAKKTGIIILTDSDRAGFVIRNHIKSFVSEGEIKNVYIPDIRGKERRKDKPSKEGLLGVEGMPCDLLFDLLMQADKEEIKGAQEISYTEFYSDGYAGGKNSRAMRNMLCCEIGLPERLSCKELLRLINSLISREEYLEISSRIKSGNEKKIIKNY